ncbi:uncharacterized protein LOC144924902 [Branchiostoma floridae x Branchiostoma belcheri]
MEGARNIPTISELRVQVRQLLKEREEDLNVLVVGLPGSCKSTLINSMNMALAEQWHELAQFGKGDSNKTLWVKKILMFQDKFMNEKVENYEKKVYFWDCAGIENLSDEAYGEFIGLTLDGKVPDGTHLFDSVKKERQLVTVRDLRKKFATVNQENRFHRLLFLCPCDNAAPENLLKLVKDTTTPQGNKSRNLPVFLVMSKADKIPDGQRLEEMGEYKKRKSKAESALVLVGNKKRTTELKLYHAAVEGQDVGCDVDVFGNFLPDEEIDKGLLILLCNLLAPSYDQHLAYNENTSTDSFEPSQQCVVS